MEIPVYLFTGFVESGKTGLIKETLLDPDFTDNEKTLIICFEEGIEEYDDQFLAKANSMIIYPESLEDIKEDKLVALEKQLKFDRVVIEYNGTMSVTELLDNQLPVDWLIAQIVTTVNAQTFQLYINNMKSFMYEQLVHSELIIFNRCGPKIKKSYLRSNALAINRSAQLIYEDENGNVLELGEDELPFDLTADVIEISDNDYGLWYMDAQSNPLRHENKHVIIKGQVFKVTQNHQKILAVGRYAMVCCAQDTNFIGIAVKGIYDDKLQDKQWVRVEGIVKLEKNSYNPNVIEEVYLQGIKVEECEAMEDGMVYFS